jgi:hypothetical protein
MIRLLLRLGFMAIVAVVCYNFFFGNTNEKAQSKAIFESVGTVFTNVRDLIRSEKGKYEAGKYDPALDKMQDGLDQLKNHGTTSKDNQLQSDIQRYEQRLAELKRKAAELDQMPDKTTPATPAKKRDLVSKGAKKTDDTPSSYSINADKIQQAADVARQIENLNEELKKYTQDKGQY